MVDQAQPATNDTSSASAALFPTMGDKGVVPAPNGSDPAKAEEAKPVEGSKPPEGQDTAPGADTVSAITAADIILPEGFELDEPARDRFIEVANKYKLPKDAVPELVNLHAEVIKGVFERVTAEQQKQQGEWLTAAKADPEFGGTRMPETLGAISKLLDTYGDAETRKVFDDTKLGDNPKIFRMLAKIGKVLAEPKPLVPSDKTQVAAEAHDVMYPSMRKGT